MSAEDPSYASPSAAAGDPSSTADNGQWERASDEDSVVNEYEGRLKEVEAAELSATDYERMVQLKRRKDEEYFEKSKFFSSILFYSAFCVGFLAFKNIVIGHLVLNIARTECVNDLKGFGVTNVVFSYFIFVYFAYIMAGPWAINKMFIHFIFIAVWLFAVILLYLVGSALVAGAGPCSDTAPGLLAWSRYLIAEFWIGVILAAWYVGEYFFRDWKAKHDAQQKADMEARIQRELDAGEEGEDLDEDDDEDDDGDGDEEGDDGEDGEGGDGEDEDDEGDEEEKKTN